MHTHFYTSFQFYFYAWWDSLSKSVTVLTGLKVTKGTSTIIVFQRAIAPFHKPGNSNAFNSLPSFVFPVIKPCLVSTKSNRLYLLPLKSLIPQTKSTGLK